MRFYTKKERGGEDVWIWSRAESGTAIRLGCTPLTVTYRCPVWFMITRSDAPAIAAESRAGERSGFSHRRLWRNARRCSDAFHLAIAASPEPFSLCNGITSGAMIRNSARGHISHGCTASPCGQPGSAPVDAVLNIDAADKFAIYFCYVPSLGRAGASYGIPITRLVHNKAAREIALFHAESNQID
jgi:hypothetical protein